MPIRIHGNEYVTVAERVQAASEHGYSVVTEILSEDGDQVTVRAVVQVDGQTFSAHARSLKAAKTVEGQAPLEVAETSAVGRALGFAGFGSVESIASAEEVQVASQRPQNMQESRVRGASSQQGQRSEDQPLARPLELQGTPPNCDQCGRVMEPKWGVSKKDGKPWACWVCPDYGETKHPSVFVSPATAPVKEA